MERELRGPEVAVPLRKPPKYEVMLPQIVEMAEAGSGGRSNLAGAWHWGRGRKQRPAPASDWKAAARVDGRRRQRRQPGKPFVPKYQQIAAEVDRRRKAGEGFDRLAREMKVSRPTIVRAYDFANRDEAAAAAREGRKPTRPPYKWSEESRAARRKP